VPNTNATFNLVALITSNLTYTFPVSPNYVLKSGDTMGGPLMLSRDPLLTYEAATKHYVDVYGGGSSQPASANLTNWSGTATNLWTTTNQFRDYTNTAWAALFQGASANLTNWSGTATNLWMTTNQFRDYTNTAWTALFQGASANLTNWSSVATNLFETTNDFRNFTNTLGTSAFAPSVNTNLFTTTNQFRDYTNTAWATLFQGASANLTNWGSVATNLWTTTNQFRDYTNTAWATLFQGASANLTNWSGTATNTVMRAITNAGASTGSLINDSNAPTAKLKSLTVTGAGVTLTDQATNLLLTVPGGSGSTFNANQFGSSGLGTNIIAGALLTNVSLNGGSIDTTSVTNNMATASRLATYDAQKRLTNGVVGTGLQFSGNTLSLTNTYNPIFNSGNLQAVSNTTATTTLIPSGTGTTNIPGGTLVAGMSILIAVEGSWNKGGTSPTMAITNKIGTNVLAGGSVTLNATAPTTDIFYVYSRWNVISAGANGSMSCTSYGYFHNATTTGTTIPSLKAEPATTTVDTTQTLGIEVSATWGAASSANSLNVRSCTITIINPQ